MMRRASTVLFVLLLAGCGVQRPIEDHVTIEFGEGDAILMSAETTYDLNPRSYRVKLRVEAAREAALDDRDEWSVRFARVGPDADQVVFERRKGVLERSARHARFGSEDLQRVFADLPLTFQIARWERGREVSIYPGTSTRATREQREAFDRHMELWTKAVARYFTTVHQLYSYLQEEPQRARYVFAALFQEKAVDGAPVGVTEREQALLDGVEQAMSEILERLDAAQEEQYTIVEEADLIFNPFPGRLTVKVPGDIVALESFEKKQEREVSIEPIDVTKSLSALEGKWISPDPLAILLRTEQSGQELPAGEQVAAMPRKSSAVVSASEIEAAVMETLGRPSVYRVRWVD